MAPVALRAVPSARLGKRRLGTRLGQLNLRAPKLRRNYFPPFLKARKTTEKALISVIQKVWIASDNIIHADAPVFSDRPIRDDVLLEELDQKRTRDIGDVS